MWVILVNLNSLIDLISWSAFNWPIDVGNSCNLEHLNRLSPKSAFNLPINVDNSFISTHIDILWPWLQMSKNNCRQLHFVKWSTYKLQQLNKLFDNFWIMHSWRHNHWRLFKSWLGMNFSIAFGEAFVRSSNLRLQNSF
jgi:hypothetical protein